MKQSEEFEIGLIIDFDNTLFLNEENDWTVDNFTDEKLRLRELLQTPYADTILCTGRHKNQRDSIHKYLDKHTDIPNIFAGWHFSDELLKSPRENFMIEYWHWKINTILYFKNLYKFGVIVVDDDPVICNMCKTFGIPVVLINHKEKLYLLSTKYGAEDLSEHTVIHGISKLISDIVIR